MADENLEFIFSMQGDDVSANAVPEMDALISKIGSLSDVISKSISLFGGLNKVIPQTTSLFEKLNSVLRGVVSGGGSFGGGGGKRGRKSKGPDFGTWVDVERYNPMDFGINPAIFRKILGMASRSKIAGILGGGVAGLIGSPTSGYPTINLGTKASSTAAPTINMPEYLKQPMGADVLSKRINLMSNIGWIAKGHNVGGADVLSKRIDLLKDLENTLSPLEKFTRFIRELGKEFNFFARFLPFGSNIAKLFPGRKVSASGAVTETPGILRTGAAALGRVGGAIGLTGGAAVAGGAAVVGAALMFMYTAVRAVTGALQKMDEVSGEVISANAKMYILQIRMAQDIGKVFGPLLSFFTSIVSVLWDVIGPIFRIIGAILKPIVAILQPFFNIISILLKPLSWLADIVEWVSGAFMKLWDWLGSLPLIGWLFKGSAATGSAGHIGDFGSLPAAQRNQIEATLPSTSPQKRLIEKTEENTNKITGEISSTSAAQIDVLTKIYELLKGFGQDRQAEFPFVVSLGWA